MLVLRDEREGEESFPEPDSDYGGVRGRVIVIGCRWPTLFGARFNVARIALLPSAGAIALRLKPALLEFKSIL